MGQAVGITRNRRGERGEPAQLVVSEGSLEAVGIGRRGHVAGRVVGVTSVLIPQADDYPSPSRAGSARPRHSATETPFGLEEAMLSTLPSGSKYNSMYLPASPLWSNGPTGRTVVHRAVASRRGEVLAGGV